MPEKKAVQERREGLKEARERRKRERIQKQMEAAVSDNAAADRAYEALMNAELRSGFCVLTEEQIERPKLGDEVFVINRKRVGLQFYSFDEAMTRLLLKIADENELGFGLVRQQHALVAWFHDKDADEDLIYDDEF